MIGNSITDTLSFESGVPLPILCGNGLLPPQENTALIKEINELRREIRYLKARVAGGTMGSPAANNSSRRAASPSDSMMLSEGLKREMEMQRDLIARLREDTAAKEARIRQLESMVAPRPMSRERLPAMEGFPGSAPSPPPPFPPAAIIIERPQSAMVEQGLDVEAMA